jgi:DNA mismatch repair ATPase MutS
VHKVPRSETPAYNFEHFTKHDTGHLPSSNESQSKEPSPKLGQEWRHKGIDLCQICLRVVYNDFLQALSRWMVPELAANIRSLKEAREHRNTAAKNFRGRVYAEFDKDRGVYLRAIRVLSELDCLFSLAKSSVALGEPSCRPEFIEGDTASVDFEQLRHPALSVSAGFRGDFIPNDVKLGGDVARIALLTGE